MKLPAEIEKVQLLAVLRTLGCTQDAVASILHLGKPTVVEVERWIRNAPLEKVEAAFENQALKRVIGRELPLLEEVEPEVLVRAGQVTGEDILRHYRSDYLEKITLLERDPRFVRWEELKTKGFDGCITKAPTGKYLLVRGIYMDISSPDGRYSSCFHPTEYIPI